MEKGRYSSLVDEYSRRYGVLLEPHDDVWDDAAGFEALHIAAQVGVLQVTLGVGGVNLQRRQ